VSGYAPVTPEIAARLEAICGKNYVIYRDEERLEPYSRDEIPGHHYRRMPEVVVRPQTTAEVSEIMKLANAERIPVTPRGAGSGLGLPIVQAIAEGHGGSVHLDSAPGRGSTFTIVFPQFRDRGPGDVEAGAGDRSGDTGARGSSPAEGEDTAARGTTARGKDDG